MRTEGIRKEGIQISEGIIFQKEETASERSIIGNRSMYLRNSKKASVARRTSEKEEEGVGVGIRGIVKARTCKSKIVDYILCVRSYWMFLN